MHAQLWHHHPGLQPQPASLQLRGLQLRAQRLMASALPGGALPGAGGARPIAQCRKARLARLAAIAAAGTIATTGSVKWNREQQSIHREPRTSRWVAVAASDSDTLEHLLLCRRSLLLSMPGSGSSTVPPSEVFGTAVLLAGFCPGVLLTRWQVQLES